MIFRSIRQLFQRSYLACHLSQSTRPIIGASTCSQLHFLHHQKLTYSSTTVVLSKNIVQTEYSRIKKMPKRKAAQKSGDDAAEETKVKVAKNSGDDVDDKPKGRAKRGAAAKPDTGKKVEVETKPKKGKRAAPKTDDTSEKADVDDEPKPKLKKQGSIREPIPELKADDFNSEAKTADGRKWNLKLASWNINGIRAWMEKKGQSYLDVEQPDVLCVQETKCNETKIPDDCKNVKGYHTFWSSAEKEGYAGTGLYTKEKPIKVTFGIGKKEHDEEGRTITAEYKNFYLIGTYVPNSGRGLPRLGYRTNKWDKDLFAYLKELDKNKPVIWTGDLNVAHEEIDLKNPKTNHKTAGFTPEERASFGSFLEDGFVDSFRHFYPDKEGAYSFWSYLGGARQKNVGWRLDYFIVSKRLMSDVADSLIRSSVMGSDHCPIVLLLADKK